MLGTSLLYLLILLLVIIVILPLLIVLFIKISKKVIKKKLESGKSVFEASFKYAYKANFVVWAFIFFLIYFATDIRKGDSLGLMFIAFLIIYLFGTSLTTLTSGLLISYITKQSLKSKNNLESDIDKKVVKKTTPEELTTYTAQKESNNLIHKEKQIINILKEHIDSPMGIYFSMILIVIYALIYRFIFENYLYDYMMFIFTLLIPFSIVIIPALLQQKEMKKSISKQFFYPIIWITLFFIIGVAQNIGETLILSIFMYLPFSLFTGILSIFIFFYKKENFKSNIFR